MVFHGISWFLIVCKWGTWPTSHCQACDSRPPHSWCRTSIKRDNVNIFEYLWFLLQSLAICFHSCVCSSGVPKFIRALRHVSLGSFMLPPKTLWRSKGLRPVQLLHHGLLSVPCTAFLPGELVRLCNWSLNFPDKGVLQKGPPHGTAEVCRGCSQQRIRPIDFCGWLRRAPV